MPAIPLTEDQVGDLIVDGLSDLLILIDGEPYCTEDLIGCEVCALLDPTSTLLDEFGLCPECSREAEEYVEELTRMRADYRSAVL